MAILHNINSDTHTRTGTHYFINVLHKWFLFWILLFAQNNNIQMKEKNFQFSEFYFRTKTLRMKWRARATQAHTHTRCAYRISEMVSDCVRSVNNNNMSWNYCSIIMTSWLQHTIRIDAERTERRKRKSKRFGFDKLTSYFAASNATNSHRFLVRYSHFSLFDSASSICANEFQCSNCWWWINYRN